MDITATDDTDRSLGWLNARSSFLADTTNRTHRPHSQLRRTRIVATIGPASDDPEVLRAMAAAGMDVARVPLAHGTVDDAVARVRRIREHVPEVGILIDLPGPKIRSSPFPEGGVVLSAGDEVEILPGSLLPSSSQTKIGVALDEVATGLQPGDVLALGDGGASLEVTARTENGALARVRAGGRLQGRPGISVPEQRVTLATPTADDLIAIDRLVAEGVDAIAVSFVRSGADMDKVRDIVGRGGAQLCSKIETRDAINNLEEVVRASDWVMVARGDLGVRLPLEEIPGLQKRIIHSGVRHGRPVITATQMLESMITSPVPTRAEVTDVANAVLDGTSAVMLSGETAIGAYPVQVVETMARIVLRTEQDFDFARWGAGLGVQEVSGDARSPGRITATITGAAWHAAIEQDAAVIIACTKSGATARGISRFRPPMPIVAATPSLATARQLTVSWGVDSIVVGEYTSTDDIVWFAVKSVVERGYAEAGDVVVVLVGSPEEPQLGTDTIRLVRVY
jgi:pyruvate kinase